MKTLVTFLCAFYFFGSALQAQSWVAPGATWSYRLKQSIPCVDLTIEITNSGTISVNGKVCDKLSVFRYGWYFSCQIPMPNFPETFYTYKINDVIYGGRSFTDTIVNFNAAPGSGWYHSAGWDSADCKTHVPRFKTVVQDTGHILLNGVSLKSLTVMATPGTYTWQVVERIGNLGNYFYQSYCCHLDCYGNGKFSCYWDDSFPLFSVNSDCNYNPTGLKEDTKHNDKIIIYPNPSSGIYNLEVKSNSQVKVFDQLGRVVVSQEFKDAGTNQIDLSACAAGTYYLKLDVNDQIYYSKLIRLE